MKTLLAHIKHNAAAILFTTALFLFASLTFVIVVDSAFAIQTLFLPCIGSGFILTLFAAVKAESERDSRPAPAPDTNPERLTFHPGIILDNSSGTLSIETVCRELRLMLDSMHHGSTCHVCTMDELEEDPDGVLSDLMSCLAEHAPAGYWIGWAPDYPGCISCMPIEDEVMRIHSRIDNTVQTIRSAYSAVRSAYRRIRSAYAGWRVWSIEDDGRWTYTPHWTYTRALDAVCQTPGAHILPVRRNWRPLLYAGAGAAALIGAVILDYFTGAGAGAAAAVISLNTDPILQFVRNNPGCSRADIMHGATEFDGSRPDASHTPFYARIKRRERAGLIKDVSTRHNRSQMHLTGTEQE